MKVPTRAVAFILLQLCSGGDMKCSVTHNTDQTTYKITDVNLKATGCLYSWSDAENYVIANHLNHTSLVITNHDGTLVTAKCVENIIFIRNCISEGIEYRVNCTTVCGESAHFLGDKVILLQLCSGWDLKCSVTHDGHRTAYKISDVNPMASGCEYSWTDADNYVIANHLAHMPWVVTNHNDTLIIVNCMENIIFILNCISEVIEYRVNCTTICGEHAPSLGDKGTVSWIVVAVVLLVVLLMACLLYFRYRKSKDKDHRMSCQICGFYTGVKSYDITEVAVEEENK